LDAKKSKMKKIKIPKWLRYILYVLGAYMAWFVVGIVLVETKVVKEFPVGFGGVIVDEHKSQDPSTADIESPHIFYLDTLVLVKQVVRQDTGLLAKIDTFTQKEDLKSIEVNFYNPEFNFKTTLKDTLANEKCQFDSVRGILAISDIEGNFEAFRSLLIRNKVIDEKYNWIFGNNHLVLLGDFFDRGLNVTECLWLIYDLEQKAKKAGGYVHFVLGNHEIMNMSGNFKYVRNKYIENAYLIREHYKNWYKPNTELGKWLQTKNIVERIGNVLFVHGGISEDLSKLDLGIDKMNDLARKYYFSADTANQSNDTNIKLLFDTKFAPFWYRGYIKEDVEAAIIDKVLLQFGVNRIVVGHTIVPHVSSFYNGKVIGIDTKHREGINEGIYIEADAVYKINITGLKEQLN
jgi:hypothetical protein